MCASRMGFNLLNKQGRSNLVFVLRNKCYRLDWKLIMEDTLMPLVCAIRGHQEYSPEHGVRACRRCHQYLEVG